MTHPFLYDLCFAFYLPKCKHMSNVQTCGGEQSPSIPYLWLSSAAPISSGEQVCPSLIVQAMWGGRADGKTQRKAPTSDPWPRSSQLWGLWMVSFVLLIWNNLRLLFGAGPWVYVSRWGAATKMLCICLQKATPEARVQTFYNSADRVWRRRRDFDNLDGWWIWLLLLLLCLVEDWIHNIDMMALGSTTSWHGYFFYTWAWRGPSLANDSSSRSSWTTIVHGQSCKWYGRVLSGNLWMIWTLWFIDTQVDCSLRFGTEMWTIWLLQLPIAGRKKEEYPWRGCWRQEESVERAACRGRDNVPSTHIYFKRGIPSLPDAWCCSHNKRQEI